MDPRGRSAGIPWNSAPPGRWGRWAFRSWAPSYDTEVMRARLGLAVAGALTGSLLGCNSSSPDRNGGVDAPERWFWFGDEVALCDDTCLSWERLSRQQDLQQRQLRLAA